MHYESTETRTERNEPDDETLRRARHDVDTTLGEMLRSHADAGRIVETIGADVAFCRMMAAPAVCDDEPQSPPIAATTGKRGAESYASPTLAESDAQHEQSPGGTVRDSQTGRVRRPRRRAKPRVNAPVNMSVNLYTALEDATSTTTI